MSEYDESECIRQMTQIIAAGDPSPASSAHDRASHIYTRMIDPLMQEIPALQGEVAKLAARCDFLAAENGRLILANRQLRERREGHAE